jgi:hypothetical protein
MSQSQAEHFRRHAEDCLNRAAIAVDELTKARMRKMAGRWLRKAAKAAVMDKAK